MSQSYYPIFLDLSGRPCVVVGAGRIATPKIQGLLDAQASVTVIAPDVDAAVDQWAGEGRLRLLKRKFECDDLVDVFLVIAATNDPMVNRAVYDEAHQRKCLINVVDTKPLCEFITPALVRRGDLTIAIGTNGVAPALAGHLRRRLEQWLDPGYAGFLSQARAWRRSISRLGISYDAKRSLWQDLIRTVGPEQHKSISAPLLGHEVQRIISRHSNGPKLDTTKPPSIPVHVYGIDHLHAPLAMLEHVGAAVGNGEKLVGGLLSGCDGAILLSTCQRIEIVCDTLNPKAARRQVLSAFAGTDGTRRRELEPFVYSYHGVEAVKHVFQVATGLESVVMLENEILGQLRRALHRAEAVEAISPILDRVLQSALAVGKKVRRELGPIPRRSLAHTAVEFSRQQVKDLSTSEVIVLGAGPFAEVVMRALSEHGTSARQIRRVEFQSFSREGEASAEPVLFTLAEGVGSAEASAAHSRARPASKNIVIFACLRAPAPVLTMDLLRRWFDNSDRRIYVIDLGMPRNADPDIAKLYWVHLWDLDDIGNMPPDVPLTTIANARSTVESAVERTVCKWEGHQPSPGRARLLPSRPVLRRDNGDVCLVGAGPGDPELLTLAGRDAIAQATIIFHDRLVCPEILRHARPSCEIVSVGKEGHGEQARQEEINRRMAQAAREGHRVVRLKGGDPFVFGRGVEEAQYLAERGIACRVIPGVSSVGAVPAALGIPLTHRRLAHSYSVVSAHDCVDPSRPLNRIAELAKPADTLVILMGMSRLREITRTLLDAGLPPDHPAAVIESGTTPQMRSVIATLSDLADKVESAKLRAPGLIIVGDVVSLRMTGELDRGVTRREVLGRASFPTIAEFRRES